MTAVAHNAMAEFDEAERSAYMTVVASLTRADGEVTSEEIYALREMCFYFVLGPTARGRVMGAAVLPPEDYEDQLAQLANSKLKYALLLDLGSMAWTDGELSKGEEAEIKRLAELLEVDGNHAAAIVQFAGKLMGKNLDEKTVTDGLNGLTKLGVPRESLSVSATAYNVRQRGLGSI